MISKYAKSILLLSLYLMMILGCKERKAIDKITKPVKKQNLSQFSLDSNEYKLDSISAQKYILTTINEEDFEKHSNLLGEKPKIDSKNYTQTDSCLTIPLSSGKKWIGVNSKDDGTSDTTIRYNYLGQFKSIKYDLIEAIQYEEISTFLIGRNNGDTISVDRNVIISPLHTRMLIISSYADTDYIDNPFIRLYFCKIIKEKKIVNETDSFLYINLPKINGFPKEEYQVHWENENTVLLRLEYEQPELRFDYLRIQLK